MALLTLTLAFLLPMKTASGKVFSRARWLMAGGTGLLFVQFLLQYTLNFRQMGVTQAVFVNLLFFVPCSWQFSMAMLYLQRNGKIFRREKISGIVAYITMVAVLLAGGLMKGDSLLDYTPEFRMAEYVAAIIYSAMQFYYCWLNIMGFRRLHRALDNYYDHDKDDLLRWMERSVSLLLLSGILVPPTIFASGTLLLCYSVFIFLTIYYCVFSLICYGVSNSLQQVRTAEINEEAAERKETEKSVSKDELQHVEAAVNKWTERRGHLKNGITVQTAADSMHIPRYLFTAWLKTTEQELFNPWLTNLRIEEAKRLLTDHPDWSNDVIAEHCGFSSRSYFQKVFHKQTGLTPVQYIEQTGGSETDRRTDS